MTHELELQAAPGFVAPAVAEEFPGLRLAWVTLEAQARPSPAPIAERLRTLANRYHGMSVVAMRTQPIPHAYRAFFRQIGLDPDSHRIPSEEIAVARLMHGGLRSEGLPADALRIALIETGVPVWALDGDRVHVGGLGIRTSAEGETLGDQAHPLNPGRLVVASTDQVHALLFGAVAAGHGVTRRTKRMCLFTVGVQGIPEIHLEEALWVAADVLRPVDTDPSRRGTTQW